MKEKEYQPRRPKVKEDVYTDKPLGIMVELKKNLTAIMRVIRTNESRGHNTERELHRTAIIQEVHRLCAILPDHKIIGMAEGEHKRLQAA